MISTLGAGDKPAPLSHLDGIHTLLQPCPPAVSPACLTQINSGYIFPCGSILRRANRSPLTQFFDSMQFQCFQNGKTDILHLAMLSGLQIRVIYHHHEIKVMVLRCPDIVISTGLRVAQVNCHIPEALLPHTSEITCEGMLGIVIT